MPRRLDVFGDKCRDRAASFRNASATDSASQRVVIISTPKLPAAGAQTDSLVELLDLFPTLVEVCGLPIPAGLDGENLLPILNDPRASVKAAAFTQHPRPAYYDANGQPASMGVSVRTAHSRYTEWRDFTTGRVIARELYDHATDPGENHNVIDAPPDDGELAEARAELEKVFPRRGY